MSDKNGLKINENNKNIPAIKTKSRRTAASSEEHKFTSIISDANSDAVDTIKNGYIPLKKVKKGKREGDVNSENQVL